MATQARERIELERGSDGTYRQRRKRSGTATGILGIGWLLWALAVRVPRYVIRRVARHGWRNRWHLAPLAGGVWVVASGRDVPVLTLALLSLVAVPAAILARSREKVGARMWLGKVERYALAEGCIGAGLWTAGEWGAAAAGRHAPAVLHYSLYTLLTGHAAYQWWWSRRPQWLNRLSREAKLYTGQWAQVAASTSKLGSSWIRRETIRQVRGDDVAFRVRLHDAHSGEVAEAERLLIERVIKGPKGADLQPGSVTVTHPTDTVNEVEVAISPSRAIEHEPLPWPGIEPIGRDGSIVVSQEPSGRAITVGVFSENGVHNGTIIGASGSGKSSTLRAIALRGPATLNDRGQPIESIWSLDGGFGTSTPELASAWSINAIRPAWFPILFEAFYAIHLSRLDRRGDPNRPRSAWRTWAEEDPIFTLLLQETPGVTQHLDARHDRMAADQLQRLRKLGMRWLVETQEVTQGSIPGGQGITTVRNQLFTNGFVLAHRSSGEDKRALQGSDAATKLTRQQNALPAKGGWHIAMDQGQLRSPKARSPWADQEDSRDAAATITPRDIEGADLEAAMRVDGFADLWEHRHDSTWTPVEPESDDAPDEALTSGPRPFVPVQPTRDPADVRVLRAITEHMARTGKPLGKTQAGQEPPEGYGIPGATWELARPKLHAEGKIHQPTPGKWAPGPSPEGA